MAYAGGGFTAYNKVLPGTYVNFISGASQSAAPSSRGTAAIGLNLAWGSEEALQSITYDDFIENSPEFFGMDAADERMKPVRDIFKNAEKLIFFRLNDNGEKASCALATAKYSGSAGNDIRLVTEADADDDGMWIVSTYLKSEKTDEQRVASAGELQENAFVVFKANAVLEECAGMALTGGTDGTASRARHQQFLNLLEEEAFDTLGYAGDDSGLKALYYEYTKRMRNIGVKFQTVLYNYAADYEGIINVANEATDANQAAAVYWVTGICAGTEVNETAFNRVYDGEFALSAGYTLAQLEQFIANGMFVLHKVGDSLRVLADINSLTSVDANKGSIFTDNQTIRVIDRIATDMASLFTSKYMGKYPNNTAGRTALWSDTVGLMQSLRDIGALDSFDSDEITVEAGTDKKSVVIRLSAAIPGAMEKLYLTCVIE